MEEESRKAHELRILQTQAREKTAGLILAGFSFVAGLAWNEAIKSLIDTIFILDKNTLLAKFTYAIVVTILIIFVSYIFTKFNNKQS
ncbi:MAG TPA: DUF5654 family protein [Candidatus Paceibacterota bacterium]|nr:DUF5654 family protein [Candidatus Paceibacterota bacterium]